MAILKAANPLSADLKMKKETAGINVREKQIEHLLQGGLRQYLQEIRQSEQPIYFQNTEMTNETCNIEELILSAQLENGRHGEQCSKYKEQI